MLWVVVLNYFVFKQKTQWKFIVAVLIAIIGVFLLITTKGFSFNPETIYGDLLSIFAFISWASYSSFSKPLSERIEPIFISSAIFFFGTIYLLPIALYQNAFLQIQAFSIKQWWIFLYLGFICTGLAYLLHLMSMSAKEVRSEHIVYFGLIMPVVSTIFSLITIPEENLTWRIGIGGILVLLSVVILLIKPQNKTPSIIKTNSIEENDQER